MEDHQSRYLELIARVHGTEVRAACERILQGIQAGGRSEVSPLAVLLEAQREVYGDQFEAAEASGDQPFFSDADLDL